MCRHDDPLEVIANTSGRPIPGMEVRVVGNGGSDVPPGNPGEIWARGYAIMKSYFNAPQATAEALTEDGWLRTGDVGVLDEAGNLKITDRIKDMYIVGGFNAYPAEIIAWCRGRMANFKVPRHIEIVTALPLNPSGKVLINPSGKVLKYELRERARQSPVR
jgi:acyl-CoA synthetase (AMP-forming)/AMP-acid ligase II